MSVSCRATIAGPLAEWLCNVVWEGQNYYNWTGCQGRCVAGPNLAAIRRKGTFEANYFGEGRIS